MGGMGAVWEAEQVSLQRRVALKLLAPHHSLAEETLARFHREASAGGRLSHPGLVAVFEAGEADGVHFIAQELVPGGVTLAHFLAEAREEKDVPDGYYRAVAELFASISDALGVAHNAGVVHRDIKPSNILITEDDRPKVADFGLAKINDDLVLSRTGELAGTPFYMSPEQAAGRLARVDERSDVFSLGATLYESLTLSKPFDGDTSQQVLQRIITEDPPDPRRLRSKVPWDLAVICLKTLEKDPGRRYESMEELGAELRRFLADEPILAKPPGAIARVIKWCRRHPVPAVSGTILAAALVVVSTLLLDIHQRSSRLERMLRMMEDVFGSPDPRVARPAEITPKGMLVRGADRIRSEFADEPLVQSRLLETIGNVLRALDEHAEAERLLEGVLVTRVSELGRNDPQTLAAMHNLAGLYYESERFEDAEALFRDALSGRRSVLGHEHLDTLLSENALGAVLVRQRRPDEAEALVVHAFEGRRRVLGEDDPETLRSLFNLAFLRWFQGRLDEAEEHFEESLDRRRRVLGSDHPDTVGGIGDLAYFYSEQGRLDDAETLLIEAIETRRRLGDTNRRGMFHGLNSLALIRRHQGRLEEAEVLHQEAIDGSLRVNGEDHQDTLGFRQNLAVVYTEQERFVEAEELLTEVVHRQRTVLGDTSPHTLYSLSLLADVLVHERRYEDAERAVLEALTGRRATLGDDHPETLQSLHLLTWIRHWGLSRSVEAEPLAQELVDRTPAGDPSLSDREQLLMAIRDQLGTEETGPDN
jgi:serine/threonine protein kinase